MRLKRLRDITNKRMVFVKGPTGQECQVWVDEINNKMYYYDRSQWVEYEQSSENDGKTYGSTWQTIDGDDDMGVYDTNNPTELFTWESGDKVSYKFVDWDGTVLKSGVLEEGETPTAPADPTRAATAQYTYTFAGWNPTVGPISKKTVYTATYTATVNEYTITWVDGDGNTLDTDTVAYGDTPEYTGSTPTKTATAQYTYTWDEGWTPSVVAVTGDATYTATFTATVNQYTVTIQSNNTDYGTVDESSVTVDYGTEISYTSNVLMIGTNEITATAETGYEFSSWGTLPATVTETLTITATFQAEGPVTETLYSGTNGTIIHNITDGEITFTYTGDPNEAPTVTEMTIMDKNIGATEYVGQGSVPSNTYGNYYRRGATTPGSAGVAETEDWGQTQTIAPSGYHIPNTLEMGNFMELFNSIGGFGGGTDYNQYALMPFAGDKQNTDWSDERLGTDIDLWLSETYVFWAGDDTDIITRDAGFGCPVRCFKDPQL